MFELLVSLLIAAATPFSPATAFSAPQQGDEEIERAARDYRIQVYNAFHRDRSEYNSRSEAGSRVLSGYRQSGRRPEHAEILDSWFAEARDASSLGQIRPLPKLPDFAAELPAAPDPAGRTADSTPVEGRQASPGLAATPSTRAAVVENWSIEASVAGRVGGALWRAAMNTPRNSAAEPGRQLQVDVGPPVVDSGELATNENIEPMLVDTSNMVPVSPAKPSDLISHSTVDPGTNELAAKPTPAQPDAEEAADLTAAPEVPVEPAPGPIQPAADQDIPVAPSAASQRLAARITEFNECIHDLAAETEVDGPAKLFDVARLLNDLVDLAEQRRDIASQLDSLLQADRGAVPTVSPIEPAATGLQATIDKTRSELDAGEFFGSDAERQQAMELLNVLENQLHTLLKEA